LVRQIDSAGQPLADPGCLFAEAGLAGGQGCFLFVQNRGQSGEFGPLAVQRRIRSGPNPVKDSGSQGKPQEEDDPIGNEFLQRRNPKARPSTMATATATPTAGHSQELSRRSVSNWSFKLDARFSEAWSWASSAFTDA